jgi:TatD DNase family protein
MNIRSFNYIDAHAHLQHEDFKRQEDVVIQTCKQKQIGVIVVGTDYASSKEAVEIADAFPHMWATVGVHPHNTDDGFSKERFRKLCAAGPVVGIGECGLDYYGAENDRNKQKELFEQQIVFAAEYALPLMIHARPSAESEDAYEDTIAILKKYKKEYEKDVYGNIHFFTGSWKTAQHFLDLDFTLSFAGVVTHDDALKSVIERVPQDSYLIETDAPYAAPEPHRGKRNSPEYIHFIADRVAAIRDVSPAEVQEQTIENADELFDLL